MSKNIHVRTEHELRGPPESYFVPAADIYQTEDELVLVADLPGVAQEGLEVTVEENVLMIRGRPAPDRPEGEPLAEEFATGEFYRAFQLPADYDTEKIAASLKRGTLKICLPKQERLKPRRIEIKAE